MLNSHTQTEGKLFLYTLRGGRNFEYPIYLYNLPNEL